MLLQWHVKDPGHSAKSAGGGLHLNTHTALTQQSRSGNLSGNKLTCDSSGKIQPQLSHLTEPLWTDPGLKSGISVHKLIFTLKTNKKVQVGNERSDNSSKTLTSEE